MTGLSEYVVNVMIERVDNRCSTSSENFRVVLCTNCRISLIVVIYFFLSLSDRILNLGKYF